MSWLPVLPILVPLGTAVAGLLAWRSRTLQRTLSAIGAAGLLLVAVMLLRRVDREGVQVVQSADWPAPVGITVVADVFSSIMVLLAAVVGAAILLYGTWSLERRREALGFHPFTHFLLMGVCGAFVTGDVFNLYVWFEVLLVASFVLLAMGGRRRQVEGAVKYVVLNLIGSSFFLAGVGLLYGRMGTLNMADLAARFAEDPPAARVSPEAVLLMLAFGTKAAVFPLFAWLPASYHTPPVAVSALFAGLLTKVGVYSMIRVFTLVFGHEVALVQGVLLVVAALTMITGVLGAVAQWDMRRLLSFHIVSQIGYMVFGLALFTPLALAASIYFIAHNILAKTNLFLVSGVVHRLRGTSRLDELGGVSARWPGVGVLFLVPAMALAGLPPFSGFFGKLALVRAGLATEEYAVVAVALAVGFLTLFSMTKIWNEVFWKAPPEVTLRRQPRLPAREMPGMIAAIVLLAVCTIALGFGAGPAFELSMRAAAQLSDPAEYVDRVLAAGR